MPSLTSAEQWRRDAPHDERLKLPLPSTISIASDSAPSSDTAPRTLLEFEAVITSNRRDRDGDILEPAGATVDPFAPLLWQHVPELPIGRLLSTRLETQGQTTRLIGRFAVIDTPLARDAVALVEFGAVRLSHGFRPLEFEPLSDGGWHIHRFEIVEVSLVSVPANTDAVVTALLRGKLLHPLVKRWANELLNPPHSSSHLSSPEKRTMQEPQVISHESTPNMNSNIAAPNITSPANLSEQVFGNPVVRQKRGSELYSTIKTAGRHPRTGNPILFEGRPIELPSEYERAKAGAYLKRLAKRAGLNVAWSEHDELLWQETLEDSWCGRIGNEWHTGLRGSRVKAALLDDATSGGRELNPEFFDAAIVGFPLLHGELLPHVDVREVPRASSIESASVGNPTLTWNHAEGSALTPFDATALVAAIDTSLHTLVVGIEVGRDFLSDSAVAVGSVLQESIAQRLLAELDKVIAVGDGTTQPQGLVNASGLTSVSAANGTSGPITVTDIESLVFAIGKQYRVPGWNPAFVMHDTTYRRARGIAVGSSDQTRVFGMAHQEYSLLDYPVRINNDMAQSDIIFGALQKYRLYRRAGAEFRWYSDGQTLALKNTSLLVMRSRWGGRVVDAGAFSYMDNAATSD